MSTSSWAATLVELRSQWQVNTRLRIGGAVIVGVLWIYALMVAADAMAAWRKGSESVAAEIDRLQPLVRANPWPARADDARQQLAALQSMVWTEGEGGDLGLIEAALQDWTRATAAKSGLRLREMTLSRATGPAADAASAGNGTAAPTLPGQVVKLRITADWGRSELVAFLAELGRSERVVVVERLLLRPAATPPSAEIDLRLWARSAATPAGASVAPAGLPR
jgi:hypothetical protein